MQLWLCVCLVALIQARQNYDTTTESANDVYPQTQEVGKTTANSIETTNEQEAAFAESTTGQESTSTESAKERETTHEESGTEPTTTAATTVSSSGSGPDLGVVEETDKTGKVVNKINGEVKLNGKEFVVKCKCDDATAPTTSAKPETLTCPNYREYKIARLHSVLSAESKRAPNIVEQDVRNMLPLAADIDFAPVSKTTLCDMDHRGQNAILSGNGGDAVEFVIALQAFQYLCRAELDEGTIEQLLGEYLKQVAPRQFFFRTSKDAVEHLNQELGRFIALDGTPTGEEQAAAPAHIQLKVKDQQGSEVQFKIKKSTPLRKLMDAYCSRLGLQSAQVRFMVDGERIGPDDTADKLGLEDEDLIDVAMEQTGGRFA